MAPGPQEFITELKGLSYVGIFAVSLIANILFIVPEEVVLLGLGYVARAGDVDIFAVIPLVILGLLSSDIALYSLSRGNSRVITFLYDRFFSKRIAFFSKKLSGDEAWMQTNIEKVIFYSRFLMQLRFLGPFMAGKHRARVRTFLTYELAALVIYVPLLLWIGWYFRSRIEHIIGGIDRIHTIILIGVLPLSFCHSFSRCFAACVKRIQPHDQSQVC